MDGSSRIDQCFKACPSHEEFEEDEEDLISAENISKATDGGSSSNSTIEENENNFAQFKVNIDFPLSAYN